MTKATTGVASLPKFSCHRIREGAINSASLKALLRSRADFLRLARVGRCLVVCLLLVLAGCAKHEIVDEAKAEGKTPSDFPADDYDYFRDMDMRPDGTVDVNGNSVLKPLDLTPDEVRGRNTWVLWCAGNEVFWDHLAGHSYGFMDLLKLCDFAPDDKLGGKRWGPAGLVIEPGTKAADKPDEFGLYNSATRTYKNSSTGPKSLRAFFRHCWIASLPESEV